MTDPAYRRAVSVEHIDLELAARLQYDGEFVKWLHRAFVFVLGRSFTPDEERRFASFIETGPLGYVLTADPTKQGE